MPNHNGKPLGDRGEALAAEHLERSGWTILERNFRSGRKEIDLVARRGEVVSFVEVKARSGAGYGHPLEAITGRKQREIQQVASAWIHSFGRAADTYRFDAVAVRFRTGSAPSIGHVEDAWRI